MDISVWHTLTQQCPTMGIEQGLTDPSGIASDFFPNPVSSFFPFPCWAWVDPLLMLFSRELNIFHLLFIPQSSPIP